MITGIAVLLCDQVNQFSLAVVLRNGVGATTVHTARHLAVGELVQREPFDVVACDVRMPRPQQRIGHHRPIANPRACVRATRCSRAGAAQGDGLRATQRICQRLVAVRQSDEIELSPVSAVLVCCGSASEAPFP